MPRSRRPVDAAATPGAAPAPRLPRAAPFNAAADYSAATRRSASTAAGRRGETLLEVWRGTPRGMARYSSRHAGRRRPEEGPCSLPLDSFTAAPTVNCRRGRMTCGHCGWAGLEGPPPWIPPFKTGRAGSRGGALRRPSKPVRRGAERPADADSGWPRESGRAAVPDMSGRAAVSVSVRARVPRGHDACRRLDLSCSVKIRSALSPCARQPRGSGPARASGVEDAAGGLQPGCVWATRQGPQGGRAGRGRRPPSRRRRGGR